MKCRDWFTTQGILGRCESECVANARVVTPALTMWEKRASAGWETEVLVGMFGAVQVLMLCASWGLGVYVGALAVFC